MLGVIKRMKEFECISLYRKGMNFSQIARELDINRKTVRSIINRHNQLTQQLLDEHPCEPIDSLTEKIVLERKYDSSNRKTRAYTPEVQAKLS